MHKVALALALLLLLGAVGNAVAGPIAVAVLGNPGGGPAWNSDVQAKLLSTGAFSKVDVFQTNTVTPTLAQLQGYAAVLVYSDNAGFQNSTALGNVLADYMDAGGGVVTAVFADASIPIGGKFNSDNDWVIEPNSQAEPGGLTLGTVHQPGSPLLSGVTSFNGGTSSYYGTGALHAGATDVADWSNGAPLVASALIGGHERVDLNFYPPSSDARGDFWVSSTDGALLMADALTYVAGNASAVPEPGSMLMLCCGLVGVFAMRSARKR